MKSLVLKRVDDNVFGTFGVLIDGDDFMCTTIERSWDGNKHDVSCIPIGTYVCKRGHWPTHGDTFEVTGVPGRTTILFHKGNYQNDSHGCILLGTGFGRLNDQLAIISSGDALSRFKEHMKNETEFSLTITNA